MSESATVSPSVYSKDRPYPAVLIENRLLTKPGSAKETRHLVLNLGEGGPGYEAGDSIGVFPLNPPAEVAEILQRLGATGAESVSLPRVAAPVELRDALTSKLALAGPTRAVLEKFAPKAADPSEQGRLAALAAPEAREAADAFLAEREFVDLLAEFPSARFTPQEFVDMMRRLMPRLYSIASSPRVFPSEVHLTIVITPLPDQWARPRRRMFDVSRRSGAAGGGPRSTFVSHSHFRPPQDGTRTASWSGQARASRHFGPSFRSRGVGRDRPELRFWRPAARRIFLRGGVAAVFERPARATRHGVFARSARAKVCVQDRMRVKPPRFGRGSGGGAHFYVCGDAKRMAKDVDAALHELVAARAG